MVDVITKRSSYTNVSKILYVYEIVVVVAIIALLGVNNSHQSKSSSYGLRSLLYQAGFGLEMNAK